MKRKLLGIAGALVCLLTLGLVLAGCPTEDNGGGGGDKVATPTANPAAGTVAAGTAITLETSTGGATIRYTTDESTPALTTGAVYSDSDKPTISSATTIKAIAYAVFFHREYRRLGRTGLQAR